jgi:hypothetical protein
VIVKRGVFFFIGGNGRKSPWRLFTVFAFKKCLSGNNQRNNTTVYLTIIIQISFKKKNFS